jgi:hypothetical protein
MRVCEHVCMREREYVRIHTRACCAYHWERVAPPEDPLDQIDHEDALCV